MLVNKVRISKIRKSLISSRYFSESKDLSLDVLAISRMPQERLPKQALLAKVKGKRPVV